MFSSKKIMYILSFATIMLVFSIINFSFPLGLSASEKGLTNNKADVERAESEMVEEVIEYSPMPDPSMPPEKALSEGKMIYIKQISRRPKGYKPAPILPFNEDIVSNRIQPENDRPIVPPNKETVTGKVYNDFTPVINELVTESVVQSVYSDKVKEADDFPVKNRSGLYNAGFSLRSGKNLLKFSYGGSSLLMAPADIASVSGKVYSSTILYEGIYPGIDLRYTVEEHRLKEDIIVKKYTGRNEFNFQLTVSNAVYQKMPEEEIHFFDSSSGLPLFYMAKPFAVDSNGSRCDLVSVDILNEGLLRLVVDPQWLKMAAYPVTIDPTIYLSNSEGGGSGIMPYWNYTGMSLGGGWGVSVNTYNLNLILNKTLFAIPGRGIPIGEAVTYNSLDGRVGALGSGWRLAAESSVIEQGDSSVIYTQGDGSVHSFTPNGSGGYNSPPGIYLTLQKAAPGNFTITDKKQNVFTYQNSKPTQVVDWDNNTTTYTYDVNGRLWKLRDASGREITYTYNASGQVTSIADPAGRVYQFGYQNGRLTTVTDPLNNTVTLGYDANGRLSSFTDPLSRVTSFTCSSDGKLQSYRDARTQGQDIYQTSFAQTSGSEIVTTVTDPGNITYTYYHNTSTGNLTKFQDMLSNVWTYVWINNNLTSVTDAKGTTSYEYDSRGNVTKETCTVDSNSTNNIVKTMTYDEYNQLLEVVDGGGRKTSYKYSNKGNLLSTSNPDKKESNGRKYDQYGNVVEYSPSVSASYNLLKNGSFETWDYWTRYGSGASVALEGFQSHGNYALKMSSSTPVTDTFYQSSSAMLYNNERLTFRADVKLDNVQSSGGGAVVKFFYGSGMWDKYYFWGSGTIPLIVASAAPQNVVPQVYVGLENASGTIWFDGVQLEKGNTLSSFNSVENSSFEEGLILWNFFKNPVTTEAAWGGSKSVKLVRSTSGMGTVQQIVPVHGGEPLTLSGMVKTGNLTGTGAYLKIEYYNQNNQFLSMAQTGYVTGTQDFTRITCTADVPAGATWANLLLILEGVGTAYFDSIKLVPRNSIKYTYNTAGNYVLTEEDPLKKQNHWTYNESTGTQLSYRDASGNTTYYSYDNLDRLTEVTDPLTYHAYYQYDTASNLIATRDPRSSGQLDNTYRTLFTPNSINQLNTLTDPLNRSITNTYDRSGRLIRTVLPNGREANYSYDNANRLTRKDLGDGRYFTYTYDGANNLTSVTNQDSKTLFWTYDGMGRVTSATDIFNHCLEYQWDKSNNLQLILEKIPYTGYGANYYYGIDNKLTEITCPYGDMTYAYDENGKVFLINFLHVYNAHYKRSIYYNPDGRVKQIQGSGPYTGTYDRYSYSYSYYDNGNISSIISTSVSENFGYDSDGRLTSWYYNNNGNITQESYQYDPAGNLLTKGNLVFSYNNANQITNAGFTYDNNGNLTSDGNFNYTYNSENQLTQVKRVSDASLVAEYTYDYNGLRKSKTVNGVTTNFVWDPFGNLVREKDSSGNIIAKYYYDTAGRLVAGYKSNNYYYVHTNLRGDVVSLMSYYGGSCGQYQYDPWGKIISTSGSVNQPFRYAGYYYDEETGLYYCKSRYYSPTLGRFLTKDGYGFIKYGDPQTLNLYAYCGNNPVNFRDPTGCFVEDDFDENGDFVYGADTYNAIEYCGNQWNDASSRNDEKGMEYWHQVADYYRGKGSHPDQVSAVPISSDPTFMLLSGGRSKAVSEITGYSKHALNQAISRDGRGVATDAILNAVRNPSQVISQSGGKLKYVGQNATVILNENGRLITTWARNKLGWRNSD